MAFPFNGIHQFILSVQLTKSSLPSAELFISILIQWFDLYRNWCSSLVSTNPEQTRLTKSVLSLNYYFDLIVNSLQHIELYKQIIEGIRDHQLSFNQSSRFLRIFDGEFLEGAVKVRAKYYDLMASNNINRIASEKTRLVNKDGQPLAGAAEVERLILKAAILTTGRPPLTL